MNIEYILNRLWTDYISQNPSVGKIYKMFKDEGDVVVNDHIAFRTLDYPEIDIEVLARPFVNNGYVAKGEYEFMDKHLFARHYELPDSDLWPRIFISQLKLSDCSQFLQKTFKDLIAGVDHRRFAYEELLFSGTLFSPLSYETYNRLREESEYAAWFYIFGFRANHFTVGVNFLTRHNTIYKVNELLKENGFLLNASGGEVKGTQEDLLLQSSTMADIVTVEFTEGTFEVPACYYEFAQRLPDSDGQLFSGFVAKSADKIFESTNFYRKE